MTAGAAGGRRSLRERLGPGEGFDSRLLAPLISGTILNPINSTILSVALVPIGVAFGEPASATAWLISALYLATAVGQPLAGRLIDLFGPRRLFLPGAALVAFAGVLGGLAPNLAVLVVARVLLGLGTCAAYPAAMRLIRDEADRTGTDSPASVLTILTISSQTVAVFGPPLGGLLIALGGWQATLWINVPFAVTAFVLGWRRFPVQRTARGPRGRDLDLDLVGVALFATMLIALLLLLMQPDTGAWYLLALTVLAAVGFVVRELRHRQPFIDLRILGGNVPLLITYIRTVLIYVVFYSFIFGFTQWLEEGRGLSAGQAGLITLPLFTVGIAVSALTGHREGLRGKLLVGTGMLVVATALLLTLDSTSPIWVLAVVMGVFGIPQGLNGLALQNAVYRQADPRTIGASAGLFRTFTYLGAMISSAAQGAFFGESADTAGLHDLTWFLLGVAVLVLLISVVDRSLDRERRGPRA